MSAISSFYGNYPGMGTPAETYEAAITWGPSWLLRWYGGIINANAVDLGNTPTWKLRPGLLLGIIAASGQWTNYSPTATNGSEVAQGVLGIGIRMQDVLSGSNVPKFMPILIGGGLIAANILNLDLMARAQLANRFVFDDNLMGSSWFNFPRFQTKTTAYTVVASDNFTEFNNAGATGAVTFTLPTLGPGYTFGFRVVADQSVTVQSAEGDNLVVINDAAADSVAFSTGSQKIGGGVVVYSNPAGTAWYVTNTSAGTNTITVAT